MIKPKIRKYNKKLKRIDDEETIYLLKDKLLEDELNRKKGVEDGKGKNRTFEG